MDALCDDDDQAMLEELTGVAGSVYPDLADWQATLPPSSPPAKRRKILQRRDTHESSESDYLPSDRSEDEEERE